MNHGRIEQSGSPQEVFNRPASEFVARFMGGHNILKHAQGLVAVRSDKISVHETVSSTEQPRIEADLIDIEFQGTFSLLAFAPKAQGSETISVMLPEYQVKPEWRAGHTYHLQWAEADSHPLGKTTAPKRSPIAA
jgi:putative spermidine/putrescine transport system ATP-binding protein